MAASQQNTDVLVIEDGQGNLYIAHHAMLAKNRVPDASKKQLLEALAHIHKVDVWDAKLDKPSTKYHISSQFRVVTKEPSVQHLQDVLRLL